MTEKSHVEIGRDVLKQEADALTAAAARIGEPFSRAIDLIMAQPGKVVVLGVGKSGHVAKKIAATLCSTGTPAAFLHAGEAAHGDLGIYSSGDPSILISKSGSTEDLVRVLPTLREFGSPLIGLLGNLNSPLGRSVDVALDASVEREADILNLAPTSSSTVALALGDALAVTLMHERKFSDQDFARFHPAGQLGRNLTLSVHDVMQTSFARVAPTDTLRSVVIEMSRHPVGAACVVNEAGMLQGVITDGDVRRALEADGDIRTLQSQALMTPKPVTVSPGTSLREAVLLMEDRASQISVLPVVDADGVCIGAIRIHDVYQPQLG